MNVPAPNFGDYFNQTTLHPLALAATLILGAAMIMVPRRMALAPMVIMACFIAPAQRIVLGGIDFDLLRVLTIFGWVRVLLRREHHGLVWKPIDLWVCLWALSGIVFYTLLHADMKSFVFKLGVAFDGVGMYMLFRCLLRSESDILAAIRAFAILSVPVALAFVIEHQTARNWFSIFGGVPERTDIREGRLRCQGAFAHAILAGVFWASLAPIIAMLWGRTRGRSRILPVAALLCTVIIVVMCSSSTPIFALGVGMIGMLLYPLRHWARWGVAGGVMGLIILHNIREQPVWHLLCRVSAVGGSTGWHRFLLIDQCIRHFSDWWLMGTFSTAGWGHGLQDITNQFVLEGVNGGLVTLLLFVAVVASGFIGIGRRVRIAGGWSESSLLAWALGVSLATHVASFIGVSYFGQIKMLWCLLLAAIAAVDPGVVGYHTALARSAVFSRATRYKAVTPASLSAGVSAS